MAILPKNIKKTAKLENRALKTKFLIDPHILNLILV